MDYSDLQDKLLFAVPKKGRLNEKVMQLLQGAGIHFKRSHRLDIALSTNMPIALIFLNASDIAKFVGEGNVDIGITGQDMIAENAVSVEELLLLGFGKCKLQLLVPQTSKFESANDLVGKRIVTSFDNIAKSYFHKRESGMDHESACKSFEVISEKTKTSITYVGGSVEAACALGLADGIIDLVESGETMRAAKLKPISTLLETQAVMICNRRKHASNSLIETIKKRIEGFVVAQQYVVVTYNIVRENLARCKKITPGKRAPTVSPLEEDGWVSVSAMVPSSSLAEIMDELTVAGAQDIMVMDIYNCRVNH